MQESSENVEDVIVASWKDCSRVSCSSEQGTEAMEGKTEKR